MRQETVSVGSYAWYCMLVVCRLLWLCLSCSHMNSRDIIDIVSSSGSRIAMDFVVCQRRLPGILHPATPLAISRCIRILHFRLSI